METAGPGGARKREAAGQGRGETGARGQAVYLPEGTRGTQGRDHRESQRIEVTDSAQHPHVTNTGDRYCAKSFKHALHCFTLMIPPG